MVLGIGYVTDVAGEALSQSAQAVSVIGQAFYVGILGQPSKPPKKPSPRAGTPMPLVGGEEAHPPSQPPSHVSSPEQQQQQMMMMQQQDQQQQEERPPSWASFHSLPPLPARGVAASSPAAFEPMAAVGEKSESPSFFGGGAKKKEGEAKYLERYEQKQHQLQREEEGEPGRLHHPSMHYPTNEGEQEEAAAAAGTSGMGMGMGVEGESFGRPWSGRSLSRRSSSHVKQVKCSVM
jgi:hypothetical protein